MWSPATTLKTGRYRKATRVGRAKQNTIMNTECGNVTRILVVSISAFGQGQDKIVKIRGDTLKVAIQNVGESSITFTYSNEKATQTISKKTVKQIIYSNGRTESVTTPIIISGEADWE